jgi:hypothetical protein
MVEDVYRRVQLPPEWVARLERELEAEIVERQSIAADLKVGLTKRLAALADERQKLLRAYYANAIPLELMKADQERITRAESSASAELEAAEADLAGWQEVLRLAIKLAGRCHAAYLTARPKVRRRFNEAVLNAVCVRNGKAKPEFTEVFEALFSSRSSNKALQVPRPGFEPAHPTSSTFVCCICSSGPPSPAIQGETRSPTLGCWEFVGNGTRGSNASPRKCSLSRTFAWLVLMDSRAHPKRRV